MPKEGDDHDETQRRSLPRDPDREVRRYENDRPPKRHSPDPVPERRPEPPTPKKGGERR